MTDREQQGVPLPGISGWIYLRTANAERSPVLTDSPGWAEERVIAYGNARAAAARREALEGAARVCESAGIRLLSGVKRVSQVDRHVADVLQDKADAIRALQEKPQADPIPGLEVKDSSFGEWVESGGTPP